MRVRPRLVALVPADVLALTLPFSASLTPSASAADRLSPVQRDTDPPQVVGTAADTPPRGQVRDTDLTRNRYRVAGEGAEATLVARMRVARDGAYAPRDYVATTALQVRTVADRRWRLIRPGEAPCPAATSRRDGYVVVVRVPVRCVPSGRVDLRVVRQSSLNGTTLRDRTDWLRWTVR